MNLAISPGETYSLNELIRLGVFETKDKKTVAMRIMSDKLLKRPVFDAEIRGSGKLRRYYVSGSKVLAYLKSKAKP